jgi:hypothetical protein
VEREGEPTWQPISARGLIASMIDAQLVGGCDQHRTLLRARPYMLDDATAERCCAPTATPCGSSTSSSTGGAPMR